MTHSRPWLHPIACTWCKPILSKNWLLDVGMCCWQSYTVLVFWCATPSLGTCVVDGVFRDMCGGWRLQGYVWWMTHTWRAPMQNATNAKVTHVRFLQRTLLHPGLQQLAKFTSQNEINCGQNPFQSLGFNTKRHKCDSLRGLSWKCDKMDISGFALKAFTCRNMLVC